MRKSSRKAEAGVGRTVRPVLKKSQRKVEESKLSRPLTRGRSRFHSANIETTVKPDEKKSDAKDKLEEKKEPTSTTSEELKKPENAEVEGKKIEIKEVEKFDNEMQEKEIEEKTTQNVIEVEETVQTTEKPKPVKASPLKISPAKFDAQKSKQGDKFESKSVINSLRLDEKKSAEEKKSDPKKLRSGSPTPDERRNGKKYHEIQIVQLESEIEEDGKYRYK